MKIFDLLRNPLVKTIGVVIIMYFALFSNKEDPESLANRLSSKQIKKNLNEIQQKSNFIISNVHLANELKKQQKGKEAGSTQITIEDIDKGNGDNRISCGDEVNISYGIYTKNGKQLKIISSDNIIIGSNKNSLIEKNITNLKQGAIRNINIPHNFKTKDKSLATMLKFNSTDLRYQITILSFVQNNIPPESCN